MEFKLTSRETGRRGFSLPELLVALGISGIVLVFAASFYLFSLRSFAAMANYVDLNSKSRGASDMISRDIRSAISVVNCTTNQLVLSSPDGENITYAYDSAAGALVRTKGSLSQSSLTGIIPGTFGFNLYIKPAGTNGYEVFNTATNVTLTKVVGFHWGCSRRLATLTNVVSESTQMAKVSLRNQ